MLLCYIFLAIPINNYTKNTVSISDTLCTYSTRPIVHEPMPHSQVSMIGLNQKGFAGSN